MHDQPIVSKWIYILTVSILGCGQIGNAVDDIGGEISDDIHDVTGSSDHESHTRELKLVYVIDDSATARMLSEALVQQAATRTTRIATMSFSSGDAGFKAIEKDHDKLDLCVTDLRMLGKSGWDIIRVCKKYEIPVIVITSQEGESAKLIDAGALSVVLKRDLETRLPDHVRTGLQRR